MKAASLFSDEQLTLWKVVLERDFMSREQTAEKDDYVCCKWHVIVVKPLTWRAPKVTRFLKDWTKELKKTKSKQSQQQTMPHIEAAEPLVDQDLWDTWMISLVSVY